MKAASPDKISPPDNSCFSEEHLHLALDAAGVGLWHWDLEHDLLTWSDQCKTLFGFPHDVAMTYADFLAALHPDDRAVTEETIATAIRDHAVYDVEYRAVWPDQTIHWLVGHGRVAYNDSGKALRMMGSVTDITGRKRIEDALRLSEEKLTVSLEAAHIGSWEWSSEGHRVSLSPLSSEVLGLAPDKVFRTSDEGFKLVHPEDRARHQATFERASTSGESFHTEYRIIRPRDGRLAWVAERGQATRDPSTGVVRLRGVHWDITERKLAEERLRESEHRWRRLMDANIIGVVVADSNHILEANQAYLDILGVTRVQMTMEGLSWRLHTPPEHLPADERAAEQLIARGACEPFEKEYCRKDGSRVPVLIGTVLLKAEPFTCLSFVLDISERKRTEAQVREHDERLRRLVDSKLFGVVVTDRERVLDANQNYLDLIGHTLEDLRGGKILRSELSPPEFAALDSQKMQETLALGSSTHYEKEYILPNGTRVPVLVGLTRLTAEPPSWIAFVLDLTERKHTERRLRENERQLTALTDAAPAYLYKLLPNLRAEYITQYFCDFTGLPGLHLGNGRLVPLAEVIHPDDRELVRRTWRDAIAGRAEFSFEFRLRRFDGVYRWFLTRAQPEFDSAGKLIGLYGGAVEIHAQKEAEAALREADRRKDEFLAMLAHELRNPLTPIANSVELLKIARPEDREVTRIGEMVGRQTTILTRIVDDLLDVSRITTGKIILQKTSVDLGLVALEVAETVRPLVASRWQTLDVIAAPDSVRVSGDPMRLMQIISNLLNNAAKYSPEHAAIRLTVERENGEASVRVRDNGYGVSADLLPHIFDLFTQAERTPDRSQGGLGIGLTVVRRLVELHGGRVEARSEGIGQGSEFIIRLPAIAAGSKTTPVSDKSAMPARVPVKVLVVDDNPDCADSMAELLRLRGFDTDVARDGGAAVERFRRYRPDIVLLDIGLPDLDGYEVARRIRELPDGRRVTLIAVTGYGQAKDRDNSKAAGFDQHMVKPVDFSKLLGLIRTTPHRSAAMLP